MAHAVIFLNNESQRTLLVDEMEALSISALAVSSIGDCLDLIDVGAFDLLVTDLLTPDGTGFEVLEKGRDVASIVLVGDAAELEIAQKVIEPGLAHFLPVPIDRKRLRTLLQSLEPTRSVRPSGRPAMESEGPDFASMVGRSTAIRNVFDLIVRIAPTTASVLISGESGTGKELAARALHDLSARAKGPFVPVNCGAISPSLMESQLFGHEKGSFTGAGRVHRGYFEQADGGTLFLDEITEMPLELQVKLLRVLETGRVHRLGSEVPLRMDVRVLAATNRPPGTAIQERKLREDLYYRLKVLHIPLPPLSDRSGDITLLAHHFLAEVIRREGPERRFSERALGVLEAFHWPGNARELRNAVYTGYLLCQGDVIRPEAFPPEVIQDPDTPLTSPEVSKIALRAGESIEEVERRLIVLTLERMKGNKTRAAEILGISLKTLYNRLHAYGLMGTESTEPDIEEG